MFKDPVAFGCFVSYSPSWKDYISFESSYCPLSKGWWKCFKDMYSASKGVVFDSDNVISINVVYSYDGMDINTTVRY